MMSELEKIKALLSESGLSKRQLLREIIDELLVDSGGCSACKAGCIVGGRFERPK